jgi:hypothetical protein
MKSSIQIVLSPILNCSHCTLTYRLNMYNASGHQAIEFLTPVA